MDNKKYLPLVLNITLLSSTALASSNRPVSYPNLKPPAKSIKVLNRRTLPPEEIPEALGEDYEAFKSMRPIDPVDAQLDKIIETTTKARQEFEQPQTKITVSKRRTLPPAEIPEALGEYYKAFKSMRRIDPVDARLDNILETMQAARRNFNLIDVADKNITDRYLRTHNQINDMNNALKVLNLNYIKDETLKNTISQSNELIKETLEQIIIKSQINLLKDLVHAKVLKDYQSNTKTKELQSRLNSFYKSGESIYGLDRERSLAKSDLSGEFQKIGNLIINFNNEAAILINESKECTEELDRLNKHLKPATQDLFEFYNIVSKNTIKIKKLLHLDIISEDIKENLKIVPPFTDKEAKEGLEDLYQYIDKIKTFVDLSSRSYINDQQKDIKSNIEEAYKKILDSLNISSKKKDNIAGLMSANTEELKNVNNTSDLINFIKKFQNILKAVDDAKLEKPDDQAMPAGYRVPGGVSTTGQNDNSNNSRQDNNPNLSDKSKDDSNNSIQDLTSLADTDAQTATTTVEVKESIVQNISLTKEMGLTINNMVAEILKRRMDILGLGLGNLNNNPIGVAAGDEKTMPKGLWVSGMYASGKKGTDKGYKSRAAGGTIGFDLGVSDNTTLGIAYSNIRSNYKYKNRKTKIKADSHITTLYSQSKLNKIIWQNTFSAGINKIKANGKLHNNSYSASSLLGYIIDSGNNLTLIPSIGTRYGYYKDKTFRASNYTIPSRSQSNVAATFGIKASSTFKTGVDTSITPVLHANIEKYFSSKTQKVRAKIILQDQMLENELKSDKQAKLGYDLGGNVLVKHKNIEVLAGYNCHLEKKYQNHQGSLKLKVWF